MKINSIHSQTESSLHTTQIVLVFVIVLYISWIGAWLLEQTLEHTCGWMTTSQGRFFYWLCMKIAIWVLPAFLLIRYSGRDFKEIMGIKRLRSTVLWGGGVGLLLGGLTLITKVVGQQPLLSFELSWSFLGGVIIAPIVEEITFRGAILGGLTQRYTFMFANFVTALLFLGIHLPGWYFQGTLVTNVITPLGGALSIFILGFVFGYVVHKSQSVSAGILTHALNNLSTVL